MQACGTAWCQLLLKLGSASLLWVSLQPCKDPTQHCLAVVASFRPSTLERYLRVAAAWVLFLECSGVTLASVTLPLLLDFLAAARASHSQDREVHQTSAASSVKALRWVVKCAQWHSLAVVMDSPVIRAYSLRGTAKDRREALPIPWALISAWEFHVCTTGAPLTTKLILGAILLAVHGCLRFGDLQRIDFESLSLSCTALHGICYATKTIDKGQPFAVTLAGLTGRSAASCWVLHWLYAMRSAIDSLWSPGDVVDFAWLSTAPEMNSILELSPASYCTAMLALRWAATLPWLPPGQGLTAHEAAQLTLHSMKSTGLASAAQLRLWKERRLTHGHHRDSATLYSRNDVFASLDVQHSLSNSMCTGWRAERSIARGGQAPIPEPPFALPPGPVLQELPDQDLLDPRWAFFVTRHEHLLAASAAMNGAPTAPDPPSPDVIADFTQSKAASAPFDPAKHRDDSLLSPPAAPGLDADPIEDFPDEEAAMVARAAALHADDASSAESSVSSDQETEHRVPLVIGGDRRFACTGPWGKWRRVATPLEGVPLRTACGIRLGVVIMLLVFFQCPAGIGFFGILLSWHLLPCADVFLLAAAVFDDSRSINSWAEHAPPRLDSAIIAKLVADFETNYPGKYLDSDAMPSVRLLSLVHKWFTPGNRIAWIPWQLRLSQKQYQEIMESKSSKMLRTEAQFLSTALFDETPELPVDHLRLSPAWLSRIQAVFRNAIALCKGAHLARIKAQQCAQKFVLWFYGSGATKAPGDRTPIRVEPCSCSVEEPTFGGIALACVCGAAWLVNELFYDRRCVSGGQFLNFEVNRCLVVRGLLWQEC
ncbi:unnamed protein product [Symbiodinium sp. CCMP2456]|nr:unnamed protein product [Symbiodinium sp. CCMP2456]